MALVDGVRPPNRRRHASRRRRPPPLNALFVICVIVTSSSTSTRAAPPPTIDVSSQTIVFQDPDAKFGTSSSRHPYFRYLSLDHNDSSVIYVGAVNHVYKLRTANIKEGYVKSADLSSVAAIRDTIQNNFRNCLARGKDAEFSCQNHVRAVVRMSDRLFVCTTGAASPVVYYLNHTNLDITTIEPKGGRANCPYDPSSNYTVVYVEHGNPDNIASIYSGTATDFTNSDPVIYRPSLTARGHAGITAKYRLMRTEQDSRWLNDPQFVGSFDIGDHVYFFFREHALEHANCGRVVYSRVARVCKNDEGGSSLSMDYRWTTFLKARLNCSLAGDTPFYFNEIYDVQYNESLKIFYGLFRTVHGGFWGSAICSFSLSTVDHVLNHSPFSGQRTMESGWTPVPDSDVPSPRPGQCRYRSLDAATSTLAFIKSYPLLHNTVDSLDGRPLYMTKDDLAATRLVVTHVGRYTVFFIGSSRGVVYKVAHWRSHNARIHSFTVAVLRPFGQQPGTAIWQMILHTDPFKATPYLYITNDESVVQLRADDCSIHTSCLTCARDPHCGWDTKRHTCAHFNPSSGMIQRISTSAEDACNRRCAVRLAPKQYTTKVEVLLGAPLHLNCTVSPPGCVSAAAAGTDSPKVMWHFAEPNGIGTILRPDNVDRLFVTRDSGLVILSTQSGHSGTYTCSLDGAPIVRHEVHVLPCKLQMDREETWKQEFASWCSAYHAYTREYNQWLCLKRQCIKDKCIPQSVIDKCNVSP